MPDDLAPPDAPFTPEHGPDDLPQTPTPDAPAGGETQRKTVAIAGATGFVGSALRTVLIEQGYHVVGLTRSPTQASRHDPEDPVEWRRCDLFSLLQVEEALEGVDYAVYLVHSMLPSSRLVQGGFREMDALLADNFARGAETAGVEQLMYVSGLVPYEDESRLSPHLASRLEVERLLGARATPLTTLRASMVIGPGGSSLRIMVNLLRKLPVMVLPQWASSRTQPIALRDLVRALTFSLGNRDVYGGTYDVGGPDVMTYRDMMARTAVSMGVGEPKMVATPFFSPKLSKLWVRLVGNSSKALVDPLVESLRHDMVVRDNLVQAHLAEEGLLDYDTAVRESVDDEGRLRPDPRKPLRKGDDKAIRAASTVRSVQRLLLPPGRDAHWSAYEYMRWLPRFLRPFLKGEVSDEGVVRIGLSVPPVTILELTFAHERSLSDRQLFYVTGGLLADTGGESMARGRLEFRELPRVPQPCLIAAIHDFAPRLPWYFYNGTQAVAHLVVMKAFGWHLARLTREARGEADAEHVAVASPEAE